jgi:hypothetical protein
MKDQAIQIEKKLPFARSFTDLVVYHRARALTRQVFESMMQDAESFRGEEYVLKDAPSHYFVDGPSKDPLNFEN